MAANYLFGEWFYHKWEIIYEKSNIKVINFDILFIEFMA